MSKTETQSALTPQLRLRFAATQHLALCEKFGPEGFKLDLPQDAVQEIISLLDRAERLDAENKALRSLAATCYAGLGAECNLPENWLDALNAAANGEAFDAEGLLPFTAPEAVKWPKDAKEVREFFASDFISATFAREDQVPCDDDRYFIAAHDFLSAIDWWADFPNGPRAPQDAAKTGGAA